MEPMEPLLDPPLKKLDWNVPDERILFEQVWHCLGAPRTLGAGGKLPLLPPPSAALPANGPEAISEHQIFYGLSYAYQICIRVILLKILATGLHGKCVRE